MTFELVAYGTLKETIKQSIDTLLVDHTLKTKEEVQLTDDDRIKRVQCLKDKNSERHVQSQYLLKVVDVLDANTAYSEEQKSMIFNGATYYVYSQIKESYEKSKMSYIPLIGGYFKSPEKSILGGSTFYDSLGFALNLREGNQPDTQDTAVMYKALLDFMKAEVYQITGPFTTFKSDHPFSEEKVVGYHVGNDIKKLSKKIQELESKLIDMADKKYQADKSNKSVSTLFQPNITSTILNEYRHEEVKPNSEAFDAFFSEVFSEVSDDNHNSSQEEKDSQEESTPLATLSI